MKLKTLVLFFAFMFFAWIVVGTAYYYSTYDIDVHNCKHSSIAAHDLLADHGIESYYAAAIITPQYGHVWVVVDADVIEIPFETISCGVPIPHYLMKYPNPDYTFNTTAEMLAFEKTYFNL